MRTLIIYDKINSNAENLSKEILDNINCEFKRAFPVKKAKDTCLLKYDFIILGGSIKRGNIPGNLKRYVKRNIKTLKGKNFALFIICYDREKVDKYFYKSFSKELVSASYTKKYFLERNKSGIFNNKNKMDSDEIKKLNKKNVKELINEINEMNDNFKNHNN
ncbi:hypothetical protein BGI41_05250 [Methanobrevibacter sp. 87.7]|uniref:flavodoxin family protein n=1 Tax=Methanobrevibacter sp. 87.7 TaxID=387957 RepID=UPI000B50B093|nr:flavodoxin domain-containing protein [Methanobrevibacter sp. 87.7]OWT32890.1 hypothetical protein BGI41_05250 [Methanobrevibacter sp. 87.7]